MSTTPIYSSSPDTPSYTVVGGEKVNRALKATQGYSAVILNRGGKLYRKEIIQQLEKVGIKEILCLEGPGQGYDVEPLTHAHPTVRFLLLQEVITPGEQVNLGIQEALFPTVIVLWNDMQLPNLTFTIGILDAVRNLGHLCSVPVLQNVRQEAFPTLMAPAFSARKGLKVVPLSASSRDSSASLYPFDYTGIYHREKFLLTGGYDSWLKNPYWQKMDFGFRCHMWGERVLCNPLIKFSYNGEIPIDDTTADEDYLIFYLKNLAIRIHQDRGYLPLVNYFRFLLKSDRSGSSALSCFREIRRWVAVHSYRFKQDARSVTELWENED